MARFYGKLGYADSQESKPGVWSDAITEIDVIGETIEDRRILEQSTNVEGKITITNRLSIVANPYITKNFNLIKYVKFNGMKWQAKTITVSYPRLIITLGDEYNE